MSLICPSSCRATCLEYYRKSPWRIAKDQFELQTIEGVRFLPAIEPISPSPRLMSQLEDIPWAIAVGSEKARASATCNWNATF